MCHIMYTYPVAAQDTRSHCIFGRVIMCELQFCHFHELLHVHNTLFHRYICVLPYGYTDMFTSIHFISVFR